MEAHQWRLHLSLSPCAVRSHRLRDKGWHFKRPPDMNTWRTSYLWRSTPGSVSVPFSIYLSTVSLAYLSTVSFYLTTVTRLCLSIYLLYLYCFYLYIYCTSTVPIHPSTVSLLFLFTASIIYIYCNYLLYWSAYLLIYNITVSVSIINRSIHLLYLSTYIQYLLSYRSILSLRYLYDQSIYWIYIDPSINLSFNGFLFSIVSADRSID